MSALEIGLIVALVLAGFALLRLWVGRVDTETAKEGIRQAHQLGLTHGRTEPVKLDKGRDLVEAENAGLKDQISRLEDKMPPPNILAMAHAIGGNMNIQQIANKQLMTKRNNVTVKLAAAHLVRLLRERGEQTSDIHAAAANLVELGCVDPDDTEGLRLAGDRFAIDSEVVGDHPHVPVEGLRSAEDQRRIESDAPRVPSQHNPQPRNPGRTKT